MGEMDQNARRAGAEWPRAQIEAAGRLIRGKWAEYREKKEAFAKSHKPRKCDNCGKDIEPGADVIADSVHVFCDYECCAAFNYAEQLIFNDDDDEYKSIFEKKEDAE